MGLRASASAARRGGRSPDRTSRLVRLGLSPHRWDQLIALAGNPNVGKTTVFNALTGLRQHTGNWPGKTVARAEGAFLHEGSRVKVVDLPGAYSLQAGSADEEVARDFILFGQPDVTVVVVDATRLERNLNLVFQILEITDRVVVCLNLMDEARRRGTRVDAKRLARELGVPVIPAVARRGDGIDELLSAAVGVASGRRRTSPHRIRSFPATVEEAVQSISPLLEEEFPGLPNARWVALRLLHADERVVAAVRSGEIDSLGRDTQGGAEAGDGTAGIAAGARPAGDGTVRARERIPRAAAELRATLGSELHDSLAETLFDEAARVAGACARRDDRLSDGDFDRRLDRWLTSRVFGFPLMIGVLGVVFWLTIAGANVPSQALAALLIDDLHPVLLTLAESAGAPWWLSGFLIDGVYLATAWVVSVMLPPMAIFFPLFTLLEDFGYLPRVAFNLDSLFRLAGAHGKQALTMSMGFGCNAAGVVATRVIDSPRERLIAVVTNNFSLCNGRWPTQILIATIFIGALAPPHFAGAVAAGAVVAVALVGIAFMFAVSWGLSRTVLRGEATTFSLELPPYRPPRILQTLYTSVVDRTLIIVWRAVLFAVPAGATIWLISNVSLGGAALAEHGVALLDPLGIAIGLNGVILLAYVIAIPANEIVVPTVLMLTVLALGSPELGEGAGVMFERDSLGEVAALLEAGGWTLLTGVSLMLFSLLHNPCSTTIYTIYKETGSGRWTAVATLLPLALGFAVCFLVAQIWRMSGA